MDAIPLATEGRCLILACHESRGAVSIVAAAARVQMGSANKEVLELSQAEMLALQ